MPHVKVRGRGITADQAADVIRDALGAGVQVRTEGDGQIDVRRGFFVRAKVSIQEESGGTTFTVRGGGPPTPVGLAVMVPVNNAGIVKRVVAALEQYSGFRDERV